MFKFAGRSKAANSRGLRGTLHVPVTKLVHAHYGLHAAGGRAAAAAAAAPPRRAAATHLHTWSSPTANN